MKAAINDKMIVSSVQNPKKRLLSLLLLSFLAAAVCGVPHASDDAPASPGIRGGEGDWIYSVAVSPQDDLVLVTHKNGDMQILEKKGDKPLNITKESTEKPLKFILAARSDGTIQLWNKNTGKHLHTFKGHEGSVRSVAFSPDGARFVSGGADGKVLIWDIWGTKEKRDKKINFFMKKPAEVLHWHDGVVLTAAFSPRNDYVASGDSLGNIHIRETVGNKKKPADNMYLHARNLKLREKNRQPDKKKSQVFKGHVGYVSSLAFAPDGKTIVSGGGDDVIRLWDVETKKELRIFEGHTGSVLTVAYSPEGNLIASGGDDNTVRLWKWNKDDKDEKKGKEVNTSWKHDGSVKSVVFSPDGKFVASGGGDSAVRLWNVAETAGDGVVLHDAPGDAIYHSVVYSRDGDFLISGSSLGRINIWNADSGKLACTMTMTEEEDGGWIAYTPENYYVSSKGADSLFFFESGDKNYRLDLYSAILNKPEKVERLLHGESVERVAVEDMPPPEAFFEKLIVGDEELDLKKPDQRMSSHSNVEITGRVNTPKPAIHNIKIFKILKLKDNTEKEEEIFTDEALIEKTYEFKKIINLEYGLNTLKVTAENKRNHVKSPEQIIEIYGRDKALAGKNLPEAVTHYFGKSNTWAVVIGIDEYNPKKGFTRLTYALNDAKAMAKWLKEHMEIPKSQLFTLYNSFATKDAVELLLGDVLPAKVKKKDRVLIYFAGHVFFNHTGTQKESSYVVPAGGDSKKLYSTTIPVSALKTISRLIKAKQILFIFNACYGESYGSADDSGGSAEETARLVEVGLRHDCRYAMSACASGESVTTSGTEPDHSVFNNYLLKGLNGDADADAKGKGKENQVISVHELQEYLTRNVSQEAGQFPQKYRWDGKGLFVFRSDKKTSGDEKKNGKKQADSSDKPSHQDSE